MRHSPHSQRRLDAAGLALLLIGLMSAVLAYWLVTEQGVNPLVMVPSIIAATTGASHLTKREASRG